MKVYIVTYSWSNEMGGHDDGVLDAYLDLARATKNFNEMVKEGARCFKEDVCAGEEVQEVCQTNDDGSRSAYYGNRHGEFYSASLHVSEPH